MCTRTQLGWTGVVFTPKVGLLEVLLRTELIELDRSKRVRSVMESGNGCCLDVEGSENRGVCESESEMYVLLGAHEICVGVRENGIGCGRDCTCRRSQGSRIVLEICCVC